MIDCWPVITKCLAWLKSISRQRWGRHFGKKPKQITSAQLPPSWGGWHRSWAVLSCWVWGANIDLLSNYLLPSRGVTGRRLPASYRQLCSSEVVPVCSQRQLWRAGGIAQASRKEWDKNILLFFVRWLTNYSLQIDCFESCSFSFTTHLALTAHSSRCRTDAFPFSICIWKCPNDSILVPAEPCSLSSPYSLCDARASCISTKGKGKVQTQKESQYLWRKIKKWRKNQIQVYIHTFLTQDLFPWQHPESGMSPSAVWWHRVPRCQQHACGGGEMDSKLQSLPKSHNKYSSCSTKPSCMLCLPAWFKYSLNCDILSLLLGRCVWWNGETFYLMQYSRRKNRVFVVRKALEM